MTVPDERTDSPDQTVSTRAVPARPLARRAMLAASGTAVLAAAAACSSGTSATATTSAATSAAATSPSSRAGTSTASSASAAAPPSAATSTSSAAAAPSGDAAPAGTPVASVADVQAAGSVVVEATDGPLLLTYADGTVVAHTAVCTHQQCTIAASGMCPCHGSKFDVTTGAVEQGPALRPLAEENVTVSGGQVYLA